MAFSKRTKASLFLVLIATLCCSASWANAHQPEPILLPPESLPHTIGGHFQYIAEQNAGLTIEEVRALPDENWQAIHSPNPNFGFTPAVYWFRGHIHNSSAQQEDWLIQLGYPLLDHINVYFFQHGQLVKHYLTGDRLVFAQRPIKHRTFLFPLTLPENEAVTVYVRIHSSGAVQMPLTITTQEQLLQTEQILLTAHGIYFGILAVIMVLNLFLLLSTRDKTYLLYVLFVVAIGGFQASLHGFAYQFFWPQTPWLQDKMTVMFVAMGSCFGAWFTIRFLNAGEYSTRLCRALAVIAALGGILTLLSVLLPYQHTIRLGAAIGFLFTIAAQITGLYVWYRGYKPALYYSIAFASLLIGSALMILNKFGILPLNAITENGQQIGSAAQLILLSFALAFRIKVLRDETEQAQLQATTLLEQRVKERTLELEKANEKLQHLSSVDPLTGTFNRRYFTDQLMAEWNRARREHSPISVIMLDIDHFKNFNDTYGHLVGDNCLRFLALKLGEAVLRPTDVVVRYGGEEFAVILPGTTAHGAETVARRIKSTLDQHAFSIDTIETRITVSQGLATMVPQAEQTPETLISRADLALYKAKEAGRDRYFVHDTPKTLQS